MLACKRYHFIFWIQEIAVARVLGMFIRVSSVSKRLVMRQGRPLLALYAESAESAGSSRTRKVRVCSPPVAIVALAHILQTH